VTIECLENRVLFALEAVNSTVLVTEGMPATAAIRLHLTSAPAGSVSVSIQRISGDSDLAVTDSSVVFDANNWRADKYIRLTALNDADASSGSATIRATASGMSPLDIQAIEKDDDVAQGIELSTTNAAVNEGRNSTVRVRLTARPASPVNVVTTRTGGDADLNVDAHSALTFDSGNWDKWRWVSFAARNDGDFSDGAATFTVSATGVASQTVTVSEQDSGDPQAPLPVVYDVAIDDYEVLPAQGQSQQFVTVNRLGGDRGIIGSAVQFGRGFVDVTAGGSGVFSSLSHLGTEQLPLNLQALLPSQIAPGFQYRATAVTAEILSGTGTFRMELKDASNNIIWSNNTALTGGQMSLRIPLPTNLGLAQFFNWLVTGAGSSVRVSRVGLEVTGPRIGKLEGFLWPYATLLGNFDPSSGLVRDSSHIRAGEFDGINGTGALAGATALAQRLGIVSTAAAQQIVSSIASRLISLQTTASHNGVLAHFVRKSGQNFVIVPGTEYSSIDSSIALVYTLLASQSLGLSTTALEQAIENVNWAALILPDGTVSHGYQSNGVRLTQGWDYFGTESLFVAFAYAAATGALPAIPGINVANPMTWNGSGFIDEMLWTAIPSVGKDSYGPDWDIYRTTASTRQIAHYQNSPAPAFGASAAEAPIPSQVPIGQGIYQAYGVGNNSTDGSGVFLAPVVAPHQAGLTWSLFPGDSTRMFDHLVQSGLLTPLNVVETMVTQTWSGQVEHHWNSLKGSWNLGLWSLGAGRGLLSGTDVNPLFAAVESNAYLRAARDVIQASSRDTALGNKTAILDAPRTFDSISIGNGGRLIARAGGLNSILTSALSLSAGATLDLEDNDLILDYTGASQLSAVAALISSARNGGTWDGSGMNSTAARNSLTQNVTLGAIEATDFKSVHGSDATFAGHSIDDTAVLVKFTYYGDTDFNGFVDGDDYARADSGFNLGWVDWFNGDADLNGFVDGDDYALIDNAFSTQGAAL
jgi:hypothetical protein